MSKYNLLLVEDHPFTRQTLSYELKKQESINLLAALENGKLAIEYVKKETPDVILMDIDMPLLDGIEATKQIKQFNPSIKIIMLTCHDDRKKVFESFSSGANGYCVKKIDINELINVIDIICNDGVWFDRQIAHFIFDVLKTIDEKKEIEPSKTLEDFNITARERNIIKLISDGLTNTQIAEELVISINTVKNHVASIINKLSVKDRTQIAVFTLKNNLLD